MCVGELSHWEWCEFNGEQQSEQQCQNYITDVCLPKGQDISVSGFHVIDHKVQTLFFPLVSSVFFSNLPTSAGF